MSRDGGAIGSDTIFFGSAPSSAPGSPKSRIKFLCSHGGKILPRPADGQLKYVGGETRVISVARDISFQELMKKLTYPVDGEMILKYQVMSEDLDALVTVKSDEDVGHMCDEIDRYENAGSSRLRAFLFPTNTALMENQIGSLDPYALEQRYIDAINGIIRTSAPISGKQHPTFINTVQHGSLVSSSCSSPRSPDSCTTEAVNNNDATLVQSNYHNSRMINLHKVHSSPNICGNGSSSSNNMNINVPQQGNHFTHQSSSSQQYVHQYSAYQSSKPPIDLQRTTERRLMSVRSVGRAEGIRYQLDPSTPIPHHHYSTSKQNRGNGYCIKCMHYDECSHFPDRRMIDRTASHAMSPIPSSTRLGQALGLDI